MVICRYLRYRVGKVFTLGNIPPGNAGFEQAFDLDGEELVFFLDQIGIFGQDAVGDSGCFVEDQGVFTQISHLRLQVWPLCWVPSISPGPRNFRSASAISKPSLVAVMVSMRFRESLEIL